jgi:hypothetical protein
MVTYNLIYEAGQRKANNTINGFFGSALFFPQRGIRRFLLVLAVRVV